MSKPRAAISWSGGKDSCAALARAQSSFDVVAMVTTVDDARAGPLPASPVYQATVFAVPLTKVVAVFNGELYNHMELRRDLERAGHRFRSRCDTETVLHAFLEWDIQAFRRFRGMFAAAFWTR